MSVSRITDDGDWTWGQYVRGSKEVSQNVVTRIKSFKNDWFLDTDFGIDWFNILGNKSNEETIKNELNRVTANTDGVRVIKNIELDLNRQSRVASVIINYVDVFDQDITLSVEI